MKYLPDTNVLIALAAGKTSVIDRLRFVATADIGLSAVVQFELLYGALNSARPEANLRNIDRLRFERVPFDAEDALRAAEIRANLISIAIWILKECDRIRKRESDNFQGIIDVTTIIRDGLK